MHPGVWLVWVVAAGLVGVTTTNPFYLVPLFAAAYLVHAAHRREGPHSPRVQDLRSLRTRDDRHAYVTGAVRRGHARVGGGGLPGGAPARRAARRVRNLQLRLRPVPGPQAGAATVPRACARGGTGSIDRPAHDRRSHAGARGPASARDERASSGVRGRRSRYRCWRPGWRRPTSWRRAWMHAAMDEAAGHATGRIDGRGRRW